MPSFKTHIGLGLIVSLVLLISPLRLPQIIGESIINYLILLLIIYLYSQGPDIDHQNSVVTRQFTAAGLLVSFGIIINGIITGDINLIYLLVIIGPLTLIWVLRTFKMISHRGFFHSIQAAVIMSIPIAYMLSWQYAVHAAAVYQSHNIIDRIDTKRKRMFGQKRQE